MPRYLLLLLALLLLSACSSAPRFASQDLQHHHWVLDRLDGQAIASRRSNPPDIEIGEHFTVNGIAGCNRYFGRVTSRGTSSGSPASAAPPWPAPPNSI